MAQRPRKTWEVRIASLDDEKLRDRQYYRGRRQVWIGKLPVRAEYIIESKLRKVAERKALQLAADEGITQPILRRTRCLSHRFESVNFGHFVLVIEEKAER